MEMFCYRNNIQEIKVIGTGQLNSFIEVKYTCKNDIQLELKTNTQKGKRIKITRDDIFQPLKIILLKDDIIIDEEVYTILTPLINLNLKNFKPFQVYQQYIEGQIVLQLIYDYNQLINSIKSDILDYYQVQWIYKQHIYYGEQLTLNEAEPEDKIQLNIFAIKNNQKYQIFQDQYFIIQQQSIDDLVGIDYENLYVNQIYPSYCSDYNAKICDVYVLSGEQILMICFQNGWNINQLLQKLEHTLRINKYIKNPEQRQLLQNVQGIEISYPLKYITQTNQNFKLPIDCICGLLIRIYDQKLQIPCDQLIKYNSNILGKYSLIINKQSEYIIKCNYENIFSQIYILTYKNIYKVMETYSNTINTQQLNENIINILQKHQIYLTNSNNMLILLKSFQTNLFEQKSEIKQNLMELNLTQNLQFYYDWSKSFVTEIYQDQNINVNIDQIYFISLYQSNNIDISAQIIQDQIEFNIESDKSRTISMIFQSYEFLNFYDQFPLRIPLKLLSNENTLKIFIYDPIRFNYKILNINLNFKFQIQQLQFN